MSKLEKLNQKLLALEVYLMPKFKKIKEFFLFVYTGMFLLLPVMSFANVSGEATKLQQNIIPVVKDVSLYLGVILVFVGLVMWAIKLIVAHGNPHKRSEILESGGWLIAASIVLGLIGIIFNLVVSIAGLGNYTKVQP
jgi:hypothetical protein